VDKPAETDILDALAALRPFQTRNNKRTLIRPEPQTRPRLSGRVKSYGQTSCRRTGVGSSMPAARGIGCAATSSIK
jgi:hypothetical protein